MPAPPGPAYTSDHRIAEDGSVAFRCSTDVAAWPWLELPPQHPVVIQTQNFWASVGASAALGQLEENKWSALTWTRWALGELAAGHAIHGTFAREQAGDELTFRTRLFDARDRLVVDMRGTGVVFRTRNFEQWREGTKKQVKATQPASDFAYAPRTKLNLTERELPLVSPLDGNGARALITAENGLMPAHPYFSGSGDHVNAPHLAEAGRQLVSLMRGGEPFEVVSGELTFSKFVELGVPFELACLKQQQDSYEIECWQGETRCTQISLTVRARWN